MGGGVEDRDDEVIFLGGDDPTSVRGEEGVVGHEEALPARQVAAAGEAPEDPSLRIDDDEPVVRLVGDQYRPRQNSGFRARLQVPAPGRAG